MLEMRGIRPRHRLGQNFLHDQNQIRRLVARAGVARGDLVLEVGPGTGALTEALVEAGATVVACEIDPEMVAILSERVVARHAGQVRVVLGDCLDGKHSLSAALTEALAREFTGRPFRLVANLPYQAATPLMILLLTTRPDCTGQFVTIQREVADRIVATPGSRDYGAISVYALLLARCEIFGELAPSCFWPAPEVTSAMLSIERRPDAPAMDFRALGLFLHTLFSKRRKQIGTILGRETVWPDGVLPAMRPEQLSPNQIVALMMVTAARTTR
ncbi:MAG: ribosomal RNA small subunit methyltransferase A [Phycisphaerales bacterium]|nr:ribosomal RNA small subunit methyltransferase A [Phycisphaerales bacterium]